MDVKSVLILLVVAVAVTRAQKKCCFPDQFEALNGQIVGLIQSGQGTAVTESVQIAFDYTNRRIGHLTQVSGFSYQTILDYNKGVYYSIDLKMKTCQKLPLPTKEMTHCVPSDATYDGPFYVGHHKLSADLFSYFLNIGQVYVGNGTISVTKEDCIPVGSTFYGTNSGMPTLVVSGYVNYVKGIKDPAKYFTVPNYCPTSFTERPEMYTLTQKTLL